MFNLRLVAQGSARSNIMYREIQIGCDGATAMWIFMLVFSPTWYRVLLYSPGWSNCVPSRTKSYTKGKPEIDLN